MYIYIYLDTICMYRLYRYAFHIYILYIYITFIQMHIYMHRKPSCSFFSKRRNLLSIFCQIIVRALECHELTPPGWEFIMTSCDVGHLKAGCIFSVGASAVSTHTAISAISHRCRFQAVGVKCNPRHEVLY